MPVRAARGEASPRALFSFFVFGSGRSLVAIALLIGLGIALSSEEDQPEGVAADEVVSIEKAHVPAKEESSGVLMSDEDPSQEIGKPLEVFSDSLKSGAKRSGSSEEGAPKSSLSRNEPKVDSVPRKSLEDEREPLRLAEDFVRDEDLEKSASGGLQSSETPPTNDEEQDDGEVQTEKEVLNASPDSLDEVPLPEASESETPEDLPILPDLEGEGTAGITGEVYGPSGEGLPGVVVSIPLLNRTTRADQKGSFEFNALPAGEVTLKFNKLGYKVSERTVTLKKDQLVEVSQALEEQPVEYDDGEYEMDEVDVVGEYVEEDETSIVFDDLTEGIKLENSIGQVEFTKKNISTAADAIAKISGANIVDGKRPVVRGLADRYITTTFNGGSVASTTPLRKAVELDLFPTSVIQDIRINKIYNATLLGDFGGAAIDIISRDIPDERKFSLKFDSGFNSIWAGDDFYVSQAPELDFWGKADFPDYRALLLPAENATPEERAAIWGDVVRTYDFLPERDDQRMDLGFSLYYGDSFDVGRNGKFGIVYTLARDTQDRATLGGLVDRGQSGGRYLFDDFQRSVDWSSMLGLTWQINEAHELKATAFKKHVGTSVARNLYNWEDEAGDFEIVRELVTETTNNGLYNAIGGNVAEILGGNFWATEQQENSLEIVQLAGRHKLFGDSLESEDGPLLEWALTRTENEIVTDTSVTRRIELDFDSDAVREASVGAGLTLEAFESDSGFGSSAQSFARSTYLKPRFGSAVDRPLSNTDVASIRSWQDLRQLLETAGVSQTALDTYSSNLNQSLATANQPRDDYAPERGSAFAIYNGVTPNQLKSFKETFTQFERTENFKTDFTFPFLLGGSESDSRLTLRTGINYERRSRQERAVEVSVDNQRWGQDASNDVLTAGSDPSNGYAILFEQLAGDTSGAGPILDPVLEAGSALSEARDIDASVITTGYFGDAEYRNGDFVLRLGGRFEQVERSYVLLGFGDGSGGESQSSANIFGASGSYTFSNDMSLLVGVSNTVARPVVKETLPVRQVNREDGSTFRGNANLEDAQVQNFDLALTFPEFYGLNSSLTLFHKKLSGPPVYIDNAGDVTIANGDSGLIRGVEFEAELDLYGPFSFDLNYAYIQGDLEYEGLSTQGGLAGPTLVSTFPEQPRHVLNMSLGYENEDLGINANLAYNYVSEFVVTLPSTEAGAFQVQQPAPQLDFVFTKSFDLYGSDLVLGFSVKNILDSDDEVWNIGYLQDDFQGVRTSLERGRNFSFWLKSTF